MAKASVDLVCTVCGKSFTHSKICYSRAEANTYEDWARGHITMCAECYRKQEHEKRMIDIGKKVKAKLKLLEAEFPPLNGTEKQIAYADRLRKEAVAGMNEHEIERYKKLITRQNDPRFQEFIEQNRLTYRRYYIALTYENAGEVIDGLKL